MWVLELELPSHEGGPQSLPKYFRDIEYTDILQFKSLNPCLLLTNDRINVNGRQSTVTDKSRHQFWIHSQMQLIF